MSCPQVRMLLRCDADPTAKDSQGNNAAFWAREMVG
jgi:hypothetical protein